MPIWRQFGPRTRHDLINGTIFSGDAVVANPDTATPDYHRVVRILRLLPHTVECPGGVRFPGKLAKAELLQVLHDGGFVDRDHGEDPAPESHKGQSTDVLVELFVQLALERRPRELPRVFDPSAGCGKLLKAAGPLKPSQLLAVDIWPCHRKPLEKLGAQVVIADFLDLKDPPKADIILMSPPRNPFAIECSHVRAAYDCLEQGGLLVARMDPTIIPEPACGRATDYGRWFRQKEGEEISFPRGKTLAFRNFHIFQKGRRVKRRV